MKKRILSVVLSLAMVAAVAINPMISYATSESAGAPTEMKIDTYRETKETGTDVNGNEYSWYSKTPDAPDGYVFAGWYTTSDCTTPIGEDVTSGTAWAKWAPKNVLSVKFQLTNGTTTESTSTGLRLVTTVDSTYYKAVGFIFNMGSGDSKPAMTDTVYNTIVGGGNTYYPDQSGFDDASQYFMVFELGGMPHAAFGTDVVVKPAWVTLDGTKVIGVTNDVNVSEVADVTDFGEGLTFENKNDLKFFSEMATTHNDYSTIQQATYDSTIKEGVEGIGDKGMLVTKTVAADVTSTTYMTILLDSFGFDIPKDSVMTFDYYIDASEAVSGIAFKQNDLTWMSSAGVTMDYTPNQWNTWACKFNADVTTKGRFVVNLPATLAGTEVKVYFDNIEITMPYGDSVTFENKSDTGFVLEAAADKPINDNNRMNPSRVFYADAGLEVSEEYGLYGIKCDVAAGTKWPDVYFDYDVKIGSVLTFKAYVAGDATTLNGVTYGVAVNNPDNASISDVTCTAYKFNEWMDITVEFKAVASTPKLFFNFDGNVATKNVPVTIYLDNFQIYTPDFTEGITFETEGESATLITRTRTSGYHISNVPAKVTYPTAIATEAVGTTGLQLNVTSGKCYPKFDINYGTTFPKASVLTFDAYVAVDTTDLGTVTYRAESPSNTMGTNIDYKLNDWYQVTITLGANTAKQTIFFNFDAGSDVSKFGSKAVTIYLDNFKVIPSPNAYEGVTFETANDQVTGTSFLTVQKQLSVPALVTYTDDIVAKDESQTIGTTGVKFDVTAGGTYPGFYVNYLDGESIPTSSTLTFKAYVEVADPGDVTYRMESKIAATSTTSAVNHSVVADYKLNDWFDVTITLGGDVTNQQWIFFNLDSSGTSVFGNKAVTIYLDNFQLTAAN